MSWGGYIPCDKDLLTAAVSAISGIHLESSINYLQINKNISLFDYHNRTYSEGPVGQPSTDAEETTNEISVLVTTMHGSVFVCRTDPDATIKEFKKQIKQKTGIPRRQFRLLFAGKHLEDDGKLSDNNIVNGCAVHILVSSGDGGSFVLDYSSLDTLYHYDFTHIKDGKKEFTRGGMRYVRPCGWKRYAIKVSDKYTNLNWLGWSNEPGAWPVSYHGTGLNQAKTIAMDGYDLTKEKEFLFRHGIYTTPDIKVAEQYAIEFKYQGEFYKVLLQNRVNPNTVVEISENENDIGKYWISPSDNDVRPYGICIRKSNKLSYF